ncbi:MAG: hypothetical protein ACRCX8_00005 [Sarcina sp.]
MYNLLKNSNKIEVHCSNCQKNFLVIENGLWICPNCNEKIIVFSKDGILREITWINKITHISSLVASSKLSITEYYLNQHLNYHHTSYVCPDCPTTSLYKIKPKNLKIIYKDTIFSISNLFTCRKCQRFYVSITNDNNLNDSFQNSNYILRSKIYPIDKYVDLLFFTNCFS